MSDVHPVRIGDQRLTTDDEIVVRSPYDGHEVGRVPSCTAEHVDRAVAAARARLAEPLPAHERAAVLDRAAVLLADRQEDFARTIAEEAAKPIRTARIEAERAVDTFRFSAVEARSLAGDVVPIDASSAGEGKLAFTLRVPVGVVAAISPFNFPLNLVAHKVAPAIAAGCPVVLKPASQTPLSALALADALLDECGLPPGWLNVVTGGGSAVGDPLVDHPDVALVTFTGSPEVGWGIRARAPRKKVGLELGNNSPVIVEPDADWRGAAAKIRVAGFSHAGQSCISTQRIYVHRSIADAFVAELVDQVSTLEVGPPLDEDTEVSALISPDETERVRS
ncbi:MAG TPA: aldehyde dehydrogenase family protein, partial [Acidimicrobiales bacterium]